jgi:hypothetical protein
VSKPANFPDPDAQSESFGSAAMRSVPRQIAIQLLSFSVGLIIVRMLPKADYAYYTIGMSMMLMMAQLGDVGITTSIIALGGQAKSSRAALAAICEQGLTFRRQLAIYVVPIGITAEVWLVYRIKCPPLTPGNSLCLGRRILMLLGTSIYGALAKVRG